MIARELLNLSSRELRAAFEAGHGFSPEDVADSEYKGVSLNLPGFVERLTWKKFKKVFCRDPETSVIRGWNVRLEQNELEAECVPKTKRGEPITFGHFHVVASGDRKMPVPGHPNVVLDYALGENSAWDFMRFVPDPLVALNAGDATHLLGCMYVELGPLRLPTPSYFSLERECALGKVVRPPARR